MHLPSAARRVVVLLAACAALITPLLLGAPADAASAHRTWTVTVGTQTPDMAVQGMVFLPKEVWVDAGDTIRWVAGSAEPHTVTFLAPGTTLPEFNPFDPMQVDRQGATSYNGTDYLNSGILATMTDDLFPSTQHRYALRFPTTGDYTYYCLVHGAMMTGTVHVRPAGTKYPFSQADYNRQGAHQGHAAIEEGRMLWRETRQSVPADTVVLGANGTMSSVMRFIRSTIVVHRGDTVNFTIVTPGAPHTVTFGTEPANIFAPSGDPTHYTGGDLNSGLLVAPGQSFKVTFDTAGTFHYICALHDLMGMVGKVVVLD